MSKHKNRTLSNAAAFLPLFLALSFACFLFTRAAAIDKAARNAQRLSSEQKSLIYSKLDQIYPERKAVLRPLPYQAIKADFDLNAGSAILLDANTGYIIYEKNADQTIPPASMTKLFLIE